jgi:hypothetical protein
MRKTTGALLLVLALSGCGGESATESAYETCLAEHQKRQEAHEDAAGRTVIELADDGDTILISGDQTFVPAALRTFDCVAEETDAPASLEQKVGSTSGIDGRQSDTYGEIEVSWSYSAGDNETFEAAFERAD